MDGYEIVSPPTYRKRSREIGRLKIRDEENRRASRYDLIQVIERQSRLGASSLRLEKQNLADEPQGVRPAFFWRNKKFDAIGEKDQPDLVIVPDCTECEQTSHLCRQFAFGLCCASKIPGGADIHNQHHRELAFFGKFFYEGVSHARCNVPINRANLIARLIFAHVF